jgi:hypothetical protein
LNSSDNKTVDNKESLCKTDTSGYNQSDEHSTRQWVVQPEMANENLA